MGKVELNGKSKKKGTTNSKGAIDSYLEVRTENC